MGVNFFSPKVVLKWANQKFKKDLRRLVAVSRHSKVYFF